LNSQGIIVTASPFGSHKSTGLAEVTVKITQSILGKTTHDRHKWDEQLGETMRALNLRHAVVAGFCPVEILYGLGERTMLDLKYLSLGDARLAKAFARQQKVPLPANYPDRVALRVGEMQQARQEVKWKGDAVRATRAARHEMRTDTLPQPGDLVMLVQEGRPPKLRARWRGAFRIDRRLGRASYKLLNVDGSPIQGGGLTYNEDHLKLFVPRSGHLLTGHEPRLQPRLNLRRPRVRFELPNSTS
jgi:hypothetical protein